jgi:hypothetical protein
MDCEHCPDCKIKCKEVGCNKLIFNREMPKHAKTCKEEQKKLREERAKLAVDRAIGAPNAVADAANPLLP